MLRGSNTVQLINGSTTYSERTPVSWTDSSKNSPIRVQEDGSHPWSKVIIFSIEKAVFFNTNTPKFNNATQRWYEKSKYETSYARSQESSRLSVLKLFSATLS